MREPCSRHPHRAAVYCAECCEEMRTEIERLRAQLAEARETDEELEWLGDYLFSLTGDLWPQNETTEELCYRLFRNGRDDMRTAIREEIADRKTALAGEADQ